MRINRFSGFGVLLILAGLAVAGIALCQVDPWPVTSNDPAFLDRTVREIYDRVWQRLDSLVLSQALRVDTILGKTAAGVVIGGNLYLRADRKDSSVGLFFTGGIKLDSLYDKGSGSGIYVLGIIRVDSITKRAGDDVRLIGNLDVDSGYSRAGWVGYRLHTTLITGINGIIPIYSQSGSAAAGLSIYDGQDDEYVTVSVPADVTSSYVMTLPGSAGSAYNAVTTSGSGTLTWTDLASFLRSDIEDTSAGLYCNGGVKVDSLYAKTASVGVVFSSSNVEVSNAAVVTDTIRGRTNNFGYVVEIPNAVFVLKRPSDPGRMVFMETPANGTQYVGLQAPTAITDLFSLTLPTALPVSTGDCLVGTTAGALSFSTRATPSQLWSKTGDTLMAHGTAQVTTGGNKTVVSIGVTYSSTTSYRVMLNWENKIASGCPAGGDTLWVETDAVGQQHATNEFEVRHPYVASGNYYFEWVTIGN